jgi:uncharacterized membrane protein YeaQ/YmgE (transglycosylase-associated protein family)
MEEDKKKHLICGCLISLMGFYFWPLMVLGFLAGYVKEWIDSKGFGQVEKRDIIYTNIGAAIGSVVVCIYKLYIYLPAIVQMY